MLSGPLPYPQRFLMKINEMSLGWPEKLGAMSGQPSLALIQPSIMGVKARGKWAAIFFWRVVTGNLWKKHTLWAAPCPSDLTATRAQ
ncbi:hypothetical protein AMELA_G00079190 [Ameiurus melas]|uniref:Uncharacterized protein n=1 Tax=Ameiurus melas TaxID=219545 RepID=A0A7J6B1R8_AMEME|nr:hypothetical protein AMELA_G00079190 [Ameiurus melas]